MGRTLIAVLGAAVVGSTGGGLAALHFTSPRPAKLSAPTPGSSVAVIADPVDAGVADPTPADAGHTPSVVSVPASHASLATQMSTVLSRFTAWSHDHAGAPCPELATLGLAAHDPWGHDLALTCTDQPADQIIGILSAGPDGVIGTDDDIASWTLGPSVTTLARGPRWKSAPAPLPPRPASHRRPSPPAPPRPSLPPEHPPTPPAPPKPAPAPAPAVDPTGDDIPARRSSR